MTPSTFDIYVIYNMEDGTTKETMVYKGVY